MDHPANLPLWSLPLVTVLGSLNINLVSHVPRNPQPGETLTASSFTVSPGGKGANQAVACAKLSRTEAAVGRGKVRVRMLGAVGSDTYGQVLLANLRAHGVDADDIAVRDAANTGVALVVVDAPTGQRRIILSPEANHSILPEHVRALPDPRPDLLIMQLEIPLPTVLAALKTARAAGVDVLLNPAPAQILPDEAYQGITHLVVNETEAAILGGLEVDKFEKEGGLELVGLIFLQKGVKNVVVTLGERGVFYMDSNGLQGIVEAEQANVIDTTAAGDTFVGKYALEVVMASAEGKEFNIAAAAVAANHAAAKTVERLGAQDSIPWSDEL